MPAALLALGLSLIAARGGANIELAHKPPKALSTAEAFVVAGRMIGASEVDHAELRFRMKGDASFSKVELELRQGEDYEGAIPASALRPGLLEYYVVAFDFLGRAHEVFASSKKPHRVLVDSPVEGGEVYVPPDVTRPPEPRQPQASPASRPSSERAELERRLRFSGDELAGLGATTVADVLSLVSELALGRGIDGRVRVARAGLRDDAGVWVTLDGQLLGSAASGAVDLRFPVRLLGEVEVVLATPRATELSAPVAVVHLRTRRDTFAVRALAGGFLSHLTADTARNLGTYDVAVTGGGSTGALSLFGRAALLFSGGAQLVVAEDALFGSGPTQTPGVTSDRTLTLMLGGTLDGELAKHHHVGVDVDVFRNERGAYVGTYDLFAPDGSSTSFDLRTQLYARGEQGPLTYRAALGYQRLSSLGLVLIAPPDYQTSDRDDDGAPELFPSGVRESMRYSEHVLSADAGVDAELGQLQTLSGRVLLHQHLISELAFARNATVAGVSAGTVATHDLPQPAPGLRSRTFVLAGIADRLRPFGWLELDLGLRLILATDVGVRASDLGSLLTPVGAVTVRPLPGLAIRGLYDSSARAPTALERYERPTFEGRGVLGNPDLRYTGVHTVALDASYGRVAESFRYLAELRGSYQATRNSIVGLDRNGTGDRLSADQAVDTFGVSLFGRIGFGPRTSLAAGTSWYRAQSRMSGAALPTLLTDTPQLGAVLMANLDLGGWLELFVSATYYGERRSNSRVTSERLRPFRIPAATVVNAELRSRSLYGFRAVAIAHNVFDEERVDDAPRPDRLPGMVPREGLRLLGGLEYALDPGGSQ